METSNQVKSYRAYNDRSKLMSEVPFTANQNIMQNLLKAKEIREMGKYILLLCNYLFIQRNYRISEWKMKK